MHVHLQYDSIVKKHHLMDILKSTLTSDWDEPESLPSHPEFIGPVNFTFLQGFYSMTNLWWYLPIEPYCKCTVTLQKWENINKWTWWNQHNEWWKGTTITARPSCVHQASQFCIFEHVKFHMVNAHWNILQMHVHLQYDSIVKKTSPNGHDEINTTSDGKEQLSLPGHPVFP